MSFCCAWPRPAPITRRTCDLIASRASTVWLEPQEQTRSEVIADVSFVPPAFKQFVIQKSSGIGLGERIVRQMLEHETDIVKNNSATDMTAGQL